MEHEDVMQIQKARRVPNNYTGATIRIFLDIALLEMQGPLI
jgi:hypothetical protein